MGVSAYGMITLSDGSQKRAEDILPGDAVRDPLSGLSVAVRKVWRGPGVGMIRLSAENGELLDATEDTAFLTADGPVAAGRVMPGMVLRTDAGTTRCVESSVMMGDFMVYDIVLDSGAAAFMTVNGFAVAAATL